MPQVPGAEARLEVISNLLEKSTNESGLELVASLAEGCSGHGRVHGEIQTEATSLVPKGIEKVPVTTSAGVGDQVQQQRDEQFRRKRAAP